MGALLLVTFRPAAPLCTYLAVSNICIHDELKLSKKTNLFLRIRVCDIGALSLGEGYDVYSPLLRQGLCDVVGFEPAPGECEKLNEQSQG